MLTRRSDFHSISTPQQFRSTRHNTGLKIRISGKSLANPCSQDVVNVLSDPAVIHIYRCFGVDYENRTRTNFII